MKNIFIIFLLISFTANATIRINMQSIGIIPNTNVTLRLQAVFDSIPDNRILYFPAGVYSIDSPQLFQKYNWRLVGKGGDSSIFRFTNVKDWIAFYGLRVAILNPKGNSIVFDSLQVDCNHRGSGKPDGVLGSITGISFGGFYTGTPFQCTNIVVRNCKFYDWYADALDNAYTPADVFVVEKNTFISTYIVQGWTETGPRGEQAISFVDVDKGWVLNNIIRGALDDAIAMHGGFDILIKGNNITACGGRIMISGIVNCAVVDNYIEEIEDGGHAIQVTFKAGLGSDPPVMSRNILVANNYIKVDSGVGFSFGMRLWAPGYNVYILNNTMESYDYLPYFVAIKGNEKDGINYFGDSLYVNGNIAINNGSAATINRDQIPGDPFIDTTKNFAGAYGLAPPETTTGTISGAKIVVAGMYSNEKKNVLSDLGVEYTGVDTRMDTWVGSDTVLENYTQSYYTVLWTISYGQILYGSPVAFPTDTVAYKVTLAAMVDKYNRRSEIVCIEHEEDNANYHSGSITNYINELKAAVNVVRASRFANKQITNGGLNARDVTFLVYRDLKSRGATDSMADYAARCIPTRFMSALNTIGSDPTFEAQITKLNSLITAYHDLDLDYVNFHWYEPIKYYEETGATASSASIDTTSGGLVQSIIYLQRVTGKKVLTNGMGQLNLRPDLVTNLLSEAIHPRLKYLIWYSGDDGTDKPKALQDSDGSLRLNGDAFADYFGGN